MIKIIVEPGVNWIIYARLTDSFCASCYGDEKPHGSRGREIMSSTS